MSAGPLVFVDTNVLIYLRDARDTEKQRSAAEWLAALWERRTGRVSTQVLQEYYVAVTRKLEPGLEPEEAREDVLALQAWKPLEISTGLLEAAWDVEDRWGFSFWDGLIVAAARAQRCEVLLSEDLSAGQDLGGLRVVDPFAQDPAAILT